MSMGNAAASLTVAMAAGLHCGAMHRNCALSKHGSAMAPAEQPWGKPEHWRIGRRGEA